MRRLIPYILPALLFNFAAVLHAESPFNTDAYKQFLQDNADMTTEELLEMYPAGRFLGGIDANFNDANFAAEVDARFELTDYEESLINQHGFMASERLGYRTFGQALLDIYKADLPVFVSTDAILHAIHMSYDAILIDLETAILIPTLRDFLARVHNQLGTLETRYQGQSGMAASLRDMDLHLTVARKLLGESADSHHAENSSIVNDLLAKVEAAGPANVVLYAAESPRKIDFSQFTPRGHYTDSEELTKYFQSMIWLGRTEIYLSKPEGVMGGPTEEDVQRQTIMAALLVEAAAESGAFAQLTKMENVLRAFIGEQDNVTPEQFQQVMSEEGIGSAADLLDVATWQQFKSTLLTKSFAGQQILSQILYSDPFAPDQIEPASAMFLLGQRFVIDSYVTGNVVYDRISFENKKVRRMLPNSLDVLFALGNDASTQLLLDELARFPYAQNLAGLRYLIDSYGSEFWESSVYNTWLQSIRSLNPAQQREDLPRFMQTSAWWQQKMNTQLSSWAQLRHDNLLYAKQSYSGGIGCEYPESYVEPLPEFYAAVGTFASRARAAYDNIQFDDPSIKQAMIDYFQSVEDIMITLRGIAEKELQLNPLSTEETEFLRTMIFDQPQGCDIDFGGWYTRLYYTGQAGMKEHDLIVADVHTAPTDASGNPVGWVMHVGTGDVNLMVVLAENCHGVATSYVGPVMSYYNHTSLNFKRHNDSEWRTMLEEGIKPQRPDFVNSYLAGPDGESKSDNKPHLLLAVTDVNDDRPAAGALRSQPSYPNPFSVSTIIRFSIPAQLSYSATTVKVYDMQGRLVNTLHNDVLPAGNYTIRWDGRNGQGAPVDNGSYVYEVLCGGESVSGTLTCAR